MSELSLLQAEEPRYDWRDQAADEWEAKYGTPENRERLVAWILDADPFALVRHPSGMPALKRALLAWFDAQEFEARTAVLSVLDGVPDFEQFCEPDDDPTGALVDRQMTGGY